MCKILPQGVGTISTPGKLNSENLNFWHFLSIFTFSVNLSENHAYLCEFEWNSCIFMWIWVKFMHVYVNLSEFEWNSCMKFMHIYVNFRQKCNFCKTSYKIQAWSGYRRARRVFSSKITLFEDILQNSSLEWLPACPQGLSFPPT